MYTYQLYTPAGLDSGGDIVMRGTLVELYTYISNYIRVLYNFLLRIYCCISCSYIFVYITRYGCVLTIRHLLCQQINP